MNAKQRFTMNEGGPEESPKPSPVPSTSRRPARRTAPPQPEAKAGVPFLFRPGLLLFLGALVLAALWGGGFFVPPTGAAAVWPWEMFTTPEGDFTFAWDADHVRTLLGAFFVLFFLFASFVPGRRGRGTAVLVVAGLALVTLPPAGGTYLLHLGAVFLGLAAGAIVTREGQYNPVGGRALLFVMIVLLAANLFCPLGTSSTTYDAQAIDLARDFFEGTSGRSVGDILLAPATIVVLMLSVLLVVALLAWLGMGGRWALWVAGIALYVGVLAPLALSFRAYAAGSEGVTCHEALEAMARGLPVTFLAFALPTAAGVIDGSRRAKE